MNAAAVLATNHTSFTVGDLDRAITFFTEALGFELLSRAPRDPDAVAAITGLVGAEIVVAFLQAPGHRVELIRYSAPADRSAVWPRPCDVGFSHIAFDVADIDAAIAAAAVHGVTLMGRVHEVDQGPNRGRRVAYLRSPDGFTLEFIGRA